MRTLAQYPLLTAALVALCGVTLIIFGSLWPASPSSGEPQRAVREQLHQRHVHALAELRRAGLAGDVEVADFGDAMGLGVARDVEAGSVLMTVPGALALDVNQTRSCLLGDVSSERPLGDEAPLDCQIERLVVQAVARKEATRSTGLMVLLVMERRRGLTFGLEPTAATAVLEVLPEPQWQEENGIFAIDSEEFRVLGTGTSMEGWQEAAINETMEAHSFAQNQPLATMLGGDVLLEELRWAYLVLHAHGQWAEEDGLDNGVELPPQVLFLWPLFLARPTPEWQHGAQVRFDGQRRAYEVLAPRAMRAGEELLFVDRRLSDASVLCYRGLWLSGRHRARLSLDVGGAPREAQVQATLQKYGCGAQPLRLYVQARKSVDPHFLSCMRMLALASNATRLQRTEQNGWMRNWPETIVASRQTELAAAELAISSLQQVLTRLGSSSAEIRQRYGNDAVAARPTIRVREAETMVVVGLMKSMKELQLLSGNEYLFEALRETTRKKKTGREKAKE